MMWNRTIIAAVLIATVLLAGCTSPLAGLADERLGDSSHAVYSRAFAATPNHTHLMPTCGRSGVSVNVAVHELGDRAKPTLILVHGIFSDYAGWRFLVGDLVKDYHLLLIDFPGCGLSDKPDPSRLKDQGEDVYSPSGIAYRVLEALDEFFTRAKDDGATPMPRKPLALVGHSLGGLVAVHMLTSEAVPDSIRETVSRVERLVLINPLDCCVAQPNPLFLQIQKISGFEVAMGDMTGVLEREVARSIANGAVDQQHAFVGEARRRIDILKNPDTRRAMQSMLRFAIPMKSDVMSFSPDWKAISSTTASYANVNARTLIIAGERDDTLPVSMSYKIWAQIPRAELRVFWSAKHSPQIEYPALCARLVREFTDPASTMAAEPKKNPAVFIEPMEAQRAEREEGAGAAKAMELQAPPHQH